MTCPGRNRCSGRRLRSFSALPRDGRRIAGVDVERGAGRRRESRAGPAVRPSGAVSCSSLHTTGESPPHEIHSRASGLPGFDGMSCTYQVEKDAFGIYDVLQDETTSVRVRLRRHGAELVSLGRKDAAGEWRGFLYRDNETSPPAHGWANHATVMGYYLHRLLGERTTYCGVELRGGNHGFLRGFDFDAPTFDPGRAALTYRVAAERIPAGAYPLRVSLELSYHLLPDGVRVEFAFANEEPERDAHVSFGVHPGFAVSSLEGAEVLLPPGIYRRHWAPGNFLDGRVDAVEHAGGPMPFAKAALPDSYLLGLAEVPTPLLTLRDTAAGTSVVLDFSEAPFCTIWSDGGPMICLEPCWGLPDSDPQKPFEQKDGIQVIPPRGGLRAGFSIHASLEEP